MIVVGIDPGLSGALFFLDPRDPATGEAADLPVYLLTRGGKKKRELDVAGLIRLLAARPLTHAFVEQVGAMPGKVSRAGSRSARPTGRYSVLGVSKDKDACRARASQLLPQAAGQWLLRRHDGRAEAALLALCGARQLGDSAAISAGSSVRGTREVLT